MAYQIPLLQTESQWCPPEVLPDLTNADAIAIDLETREIVSKMTTGARPARIDVAVLPADRVSNAGASR